MLLKDLETYVLETFKVELWSKSDLNRFYFDLAPKTKCYIDLKIDSDGTVISFKAYTFYIGNTVHKNWIKEYLKEPNAHMKSLIEQIKEHFNLTEKEVT